MCEKKPGPRCSADALKALVIANKKVVALTPSLETTKDSFKNLDLNLAEFDDIDYVGEAYFNTSAQMNKALLAKNDAEINYNSTKEGLASLDRAISVTGGALESTVIKVFVDKDLPDEEVTILTSKKKRLEVSRALAASQREWQHSTRRSLTDAEKNSLDKALLFGSSILYEVENKQSELFNKRSRLSRMRYGFARVQVLTSDESYKENIASLTSQVNSLTQQVNMFYSRKKDMEAYVNDIKKKIAERNIS